MVLAKQIKEFVKKLNRVLPRPTNPISLTINCQDLSVTHFQAVQEELFLLFYLSKTLERRFYLNFHLLLRLSLLLHNPRH